MSKLELIALSGVVYKVKNTGPSTEPCGTPYESVTLFILATIFSKILEMKLKLNTGL